MVKHIYCSLPAIMQGRDHLIDDIKAKLIHLNGEVETNQRVRFSVWRPGDTYKESLVHDADIFMLWHPDNKFDFTMDSLPAGIVKELKLAIRESKKLLLIYRNKDRTLGFYDIDKTDLECNYHVRGIPGTSRGLHTYITKKVGNVGIQPKENLDPDYPKPQMPEPAVSKMEITGDKRLLLTIK